MAKKYFNDREFIKPESISPELRERLERTRQRAGVPMVITGSWRKRKGRKRISAHELNKDGFYHGVDVKAHTSRVRMRIVSAALEVGFTRIGVYNRHIHLDVAHGSPFAQGVIWVGLSK